MRERSWFIDQLKRQLSFLTRSCQSFDAGNVDEAIRVAVCIRILLHTTRSSTSLLQHLNAPDLPLLSTVPVDSSVSQLLGFDGLTGITPNGIGPKLSLISSGVQLKAPDWWTQVVYVNRGVTTTRRQLVLAAANRDGGAHVDPQLTHDYELLFKNFWYELVLNDETVPLDSLHLIGIRQLGHEILGSPALARLATEA
jgi:hypothetical protein